MISIARAQYEEYIHSENWQQKRSERMAIDGNKCQFCKATDDLQVHHRNYKRLGCEDASEDLITLCRGCHEQIHTIVETYKETRDKIVAEYTKYLTDAIVPIMDRYKDAQSDEIAKLIAPLSKNKWAHIQKIVGVFREMAKVDCPFSFGMLGYSQKTIHHEAIRKAAQMRRHSK